MADNRTSNSELFLLTDGEVADLLGIAPTTLQAILRRRQTPRPLRPAPAAQSSSIGGDSQQGGKR
jgi:hypothetical protein